MKNFRIPFIVMVILSVTLLGCGKGGNKKDEKKAVNPALKVDVPKGAFAIDNAHSAIVFKILHLGISYTYGRFNDFGGYVLWNEKDLSKSKILFKIDVNSVYTNNVKRDGHLRSPDFFDAKKFPTAVFSSKTISNKGKGRYQVTGDFEIHGVKKEITIPFSIVGKLEKGPWGFKRAGAEAEFTLKRSDYGISLIDKKMPGAVGPVAHLKVVIEGMHK